VAYDADRANRIRELVLTEQNLTEKRMFGGHTHTLSRCAGA
jgi:hypothetical protein